MCGWVLAFRQEPPCCHSNKLTSIPSGGFLSLSDVEILLTCNEALRENFVLHHHSLIYYPFYPLWKKKTKWLVTLTVYVSTTYFLHENTNGPLSSWIHPTPFGDHTFRSNVTVWFWFSRVSSCVQTAQRESIAPVSWCLWAPLAQRWFWEGRLWSWNALLRACEWHLL